MGQWLDSPFLFWFFDSIQRICLSHSHLNLGLYLSFPDNQRSKELHHLYYLYFSAFNRSLGQLKNATKLVCLPPPFLPPARVLTLTHHLHWYAQLQTGCRRERQGRTMGEWEGRTTWNTNTYMQKAHTVLGHRHSFYCPRRAVRDFPAAFSKHGQYP